MAGAQRKYPGASGEAAGAAGDTGIAIEVLDHASRRLGLMGVNIPEASAADRVIRLRRLSVLARIDELGVRCSCIQPIAVFGDDLDAMAARCS